MSFHVLGAKTNAKSLPSTSPHSTHTENSCRRDAATRDTFYSLSTSSCRRRQVNCARTIFMLPGSQCAQKQATTNMFFTYRIEENLRNQRYADIH